MKRSYQKIAFCVSKALFVCAIKLQCSLIIIKTEINHTNMGTAVHIWSVPHISSCCFNAHTRAPNVLIHGWVGKLKRTNKQMKILLLSDFLIKMSCVKFACSNVSCKLNIFTSHQLFSQKIISHVTKTFSDCHFPYGNLLICISASTPAYGNKTQLMKSHSICFWTC